MRFFKKNLVSLKTAIFLLSAICVLSIVGTLIPQNQEAGEYLRLFPKLGHWILAIHADDMYHSPLFMFFLGWLAFSAYLCTVTRFSVTRKRLFERLKWISPAEIRSFPVQTELDPETAAIPETGDWQRKETDDGFLLLFRASGRPALLGGVFLHIGLLLVLAGGLVDAFLGVETVIRGMPGEQVPIPDLAGMRAASKADKIRNLGRQIQDVNPNDPRLSELRIEIDRLDRIYQSALASPAFKVFFADLWVDLHDGNASESPASVRNWNSRLRFIEKGLVTATAVLRVNEPFSYEGFSFYQADWSKKFRDVRFSVTPKMEAGSETLSIGTPTSNIGSFSVTVFPPASFSLIASIGVPIKPDWSTCTWVLHDFWPDFKVEGEEFISASDDLNNPAGRLAAYDDDGNQIGRVWAFTKHMTDLSGQMSNLPYTFIIEGAETSFESGIQVVHNPGTLMVWIGCFLFSLGMALTFFVSYIEEWVMKRPEGRLVLAVNGNQHPLRLKPHLEKLRLRLTSSGAQKQS